jgi:hypothetical protein
MTTNLLEAKAASLSLKQTDYKLLRFSHQEECQQSGDHEEICVRCFFHKFLTNKKPQHGVCPSGGDSWCKFKNSARSGVAYAHKHSLQAAVMVAIKPVFRDLTGVGPLKKYFHGKTHNPHDHVNSVIWTRISKTVFVGLDTLKCGVQDAVLCFNDGVAERNVLNILGMRSGSNTVNVVKQRDMGRIRKAEIATLSI